jgi:hypothetical protein
MRNYLLSPEGLKQIGETDLLRFRQGSTFMSPGGPALLPIALMQNEADAMAGLLKKDQNFVYWLTPDFRILFTTKNGLWKIVFEWRRDHEGKSATMRARVDRRVTTAEALPGVEAFLAEIKKSAEALQVSAAGETGETGDARVEIEGIEDEARIQQLLQDEEVHDAG